MENFRCIKKEKKKHLLKPQVKPLQAGWEKKKYVTGGNKLLIQYLPL